MTLFALVGIPCFTLLLGALADAWGPGHRSTSTLRAQVVLFLKGAALAVPALLVLLLLRRTIGVSYRALLLYLHGALIDHLLPAAVLAVACIFWLPKAGFHQLLFFGGGFYSLISLGTTLTAYGQYDAHLLFLLPALRMAAVVLLPLLLLHFQESYGPWRAAYGSALAAVALGGGCASYLFARFFALPSVLLSAGILGGGLLLCYLESR